MLTDTAAMVLSATVCTLAEIWTAGPSLTSLNYSLDINRKFSAEVKLFVKKKKVQE